MKKEILRDYYPNRVSAENYMFSEGKRLTAVSLVTMTILIVIGIAAIIVGTIIPFIDFEELFIILGLSIDAVGAILFTIGICGIVNYRRGWLYLSTAEQLYYLRLIANEEEETDVRDTSPIAKDSALPNYSSAPVPAGMWRCTCGKEHPAYVSSCSCGVNKSDIQ